jgi:hypothetical protein
VLANLTTAALQTKKCWHNLRPPRYKQKSAGTTYDRRATNKKARLVAALFLTEQDNTTPRG